MPRSNANSHVGFRRVVHGTRIVALAAGVSVTLATLAVSAQLDPGLRA